MRKISWSSGLKTEVTKWIHCRIRSRKKYDKRSTVHSQNPIFILIDLWQKGSTCFPSIFPTPQTKTEKSGNLRQCLTREILYLSHNRLHFWTYYDRWFWFSRAILPLSTSTMKTAQNRREKHHRLGIDTIPRALQRREHHQVGIFSITHTPCYIIRRIREQYQVNLKRDLPHIPFAPAFWEFVEAGKRLADVHVHYEDQPEYKLDLIETPDIPLDWRAAQMKFSKDKNTDKNTTIFLTLAGIPRGGVTVSVREPLGVGVGGGSVSCQNRQTERHRERPRTAQTMKPTS